MSSVQKVSFKNYSTANFNAISGGGQFQVNSKKESKKMHTALYFSTGAAVVSLGVGGVIAYRHKSLAKQMEKSVKQTAELLESLTKKLSQDTQQASEGFAAKIAEETQIVTKALTEKIENGMNSVNKKVKELGKWQDGQISGVRKELSEKIAQINAKVQNSGEKNFSISVVNVNGTELELANVMNGYGKHTGTLEKELRTEAFKRIFSAADRSAIIPKDDITIRVPTSEFKGFSSTGGLSVVPKEVIANLGGIINQKQNVRLVVDTPMYLGQVEDNTFYSLIKQADGTFSYITSKTNKPMASLEKIDSVNIPIYTDKNRTVENVDLFMARNQEQIVDLDLLMPWLDKGLAEEISQAISKGKSFEINQNILNIKYDPEKGITKPTAKIKYDVLFYKNDKFRMNGPVVDEQAKNIYNNLTHEAGETERFIYFDKYFYEYLTKGAETSNENLTADLIIGNDWQSGGISAMMKLLTTVKKYFGMDPKVADKIYNTPVMTIMHNAGLSGDVWHSQSKLLNVMFGEHASMITKNAWMPADAGLNNTALNGLFHGNNLNPQTMAVAYSDVLTPVSKGYGVEMASHSGFGGANHDLFRMRARMHEFSDIDHIKYLAKRNGVDPKLISKKNLAYRPITNGCDRVNNVLTEAVARKIEGAVGLKPGSLRLRRQGESILDWHLSNKEVYLNKVVEEVNMARMGKGNPMNIELANMTNLEGVTKNTMVVSTAGRIVDQKGLDIFAEAIEEFLSRHTNDADLPVFYAQGVGDRVFIEKILDVKRRVAEKFGQKAADRIVFARLFSEPGRYDGCKLMSDFTVISSWFEPCGLVHKEIAAFSGAIPIVNKVGGLTDGLKDGVNAIFAEFKHKFDNYLDALMYNRKYFADALDKAYELFNDKKRFGKVIKNSYEANHSWLKKGGPMEEYAKVFVEYGVLKPEVLQRHS